MKRLSKLLKIRDCWELLFTKYLENLGPQKCPKLNPNFITGSVQGINEEGEGLFKDQNYIFKDHEDTFLTL